MKTGAIKHFTTVFFLFDVRCHVALGDATTPHSTMIFGGEQDREFYERLKEVIIKVETTTKCAKS